MKRISTLIASAALLAVVSTNDGYPTFHESDFDHKDFKQVDLNSNFNKTNTHEMANQFNANRTETDNSNYKKAVNFDHEKEYQKDLKNYREIDAKKGKNFTKGHDLSITGENKLDTVNNENLTAERDHKCDRVRNADYHHEQVEEKAHIVTENDTKLGERVKAQKWIKKRQQKRAVKENEGEGRNVKLVKNKALQVNKSNLKKVDEGKKAATKANLEDTYIKINNKHKEEDVGEKSQKTREVNIGEMESEAVSKARNGSDVSNVSVGKDLKVKKVKETKNVEVDHN